MLHARGDAIVRGNQGGHTVRMLGEMLWRLGWLGSPIGSWLFLRYTKTWVRTVDSGSNTCGEANCSDTVGWGEMRCKGHRSFLLPPVTSRRQIWLAIPRFWFVGAAISALLVSVGRAWKLAETWTLQPFIDALPAVWG